MKNSFFSFFFLCALSMGIAQIDRSQQPPSGPAPSIAIGDPQKMVLDNGLTLLVVENHKLPQVSVSLRMDRPLQPEGDKVGAESLLSSMMGKGSQQTPKDDFEAEIDFMGARLSFSENGAYANSLKRYFPRVLELLSQATLDPLFLEEEFKKEKEKALEGLRADEKNVAAAARRVENLISYGALHPYGEFLTEEKVSRLNLNDIKKKYENLYHAGDSYLIVVGDITFEEVAGLVKKNFGRWKAKNIMVPPVAVPENTPSTSLHYVDMPNAVQTEIAVVNLASLTRKDSDYFPVLIANQVLGGGAEARLFQNLREDKGYTYGSYSSFNTNHKTKSKFRASSSVRNAVADCAVVEMLKEIKKLAQEPITQEELDLVKAKYAGAFILSLEDPELIADFAYNVITQDLDKDFYRNFLKNINAVTSKDVQRVAKDYFLANQASIFVTGKGRDILDALEHISFNGKKLPLHYYDKFGTSIERPNYEMAGDLSAASIIEQHIKALGGMEQLQAIHSLKTIYKGEIQGTPLSIETTVTDNKQLLLEMKMMGNTMQKQVVNQTQGYMMMQGQKIDFEGELLTKSIEQAQIFPELTLDMNQLELIGETDVDGMKAYEVQIAEGKTFFYAADSFYKIQTAETISMGGQTQTTITKYGDFKKIEGIAMPHTTTISMGPQEIEFSLEEATFNVPIDATIFD